MDRRFFRFVGCRNIFDRREGWRRIRAVVDLWLSEIAFKNEMQVLCVSGLLDWFEELRRKPAMRIINKEDRAENKEAETENDTTSGYASYQETVLSK